MESYKDSIEYFLSYFECAVPGDVSLGSLVVFSERHAHEDESEEPVMWDEKDLPRTWYQMRFVDSVNKSKYIKKMAYAESMDVYHITPKKLSKALTSIDLQFLKKITPNDLVEYDGDDGNESSSIKQIRLKNEGLMNFVAHELSTRKNYNYFFKVLEHLEKIRNFNSIHCITRAFQMQKLDLKSLGKLSVYVKTSLSYFDMRQVLDELTADDMFLVCPIDVYIKDIEESNKNRGSEVASMRFCRLVEILIRLQTQEHDLRIPHITEHFLFTRFWKYARNNSVLYIQDDAMKYDGQFLLL
ncbi:hypothetical protein M896_080180 [Ordospora colligata OC4]|uniref:Ras-GEF domain-containing protein n=1 Tax=Ordospora colligata OC4 TaxID=1354746 RepID=A0A0B2UJA3_9MICR|nr:uncharacterized protein M896_080180 [Ordospora colligata OC4]KHN69284.1 hypothetical protein M896_080180 [Ordospora colligata OC4]TBU15100.1 hypothetical protein CWI41_080190 [Ordospora colligata]TBU15151.1 hypothetical protein CWI40_080190 [Ordospora colligata]